MLSRLPSIIFAFIAAALCFASGFSLANPPIDNWQEVVRQSPYWISKGAFDNLVTIRSWVLNSNSFCENRNRHILFDRRATFLGYISNGDTGEQTQQRLNNERKNLWQQQRVKFWLSGDENNYGYPFALSCDQPDAQLAVSLARYLGQEPTARLWGTWDGMRIGERENLVSLHEAITIVYNDRIKQNRISLPPAVLSTLAGKALIESGGQKAAHSAADARGILQLSPKALSDCGLEEQFHFHRMAQVDCALRLMEQNHRNLRPSFDKVFGNLPEKKSSELYSLLLIQAYHGGVGRVGDLLSEPGLNAAALYFSAHAEKFSAGDIALGIIYHNLGRNQLGFASLYYLADNQVAKNLVCRETKNLPGC